MRKLRHWKQRYDKNARFVWRRPTMFGRRAYEPGDLIPPELEANKTKLRRFWESGRIELAEFEDPNVATGLTPSQQFQQELALMRVRNEAAAKDFLEDVDEDADII